MQNAQTQGGFFNGLGNIFLDAFDTTKDVVIARELGEGSGEHAEGITEFGNTNTVLIAIAGAAALGALLFLLRGQK